MSGHFHVLLLPNRWPNWKQIFRKVGSVSWVVIRDVRNSVVALSFPNSLLQVWCPWLARLEEPRSVIDRRSDSLRMISRLWIPLLPSACLLRELAASHLESRRALFFSLLQLECEALQMFHCEGKYRSGWLVQRFLFSYQKPLHCLQEELLLLKSVEEAFQSKENRLAKLIIF